VLIEDYFQSIDSHIARCPYIFDSYVIKDKRSFYIGIIEGRINFLDGSELYFLEFVDSREGVRRYKYSYHCQDKDGKLRFRYDMAPHHKEIKTFPHHKHLADRVIQSPQPSFEDILEEVENIPYSST